LDRSHNSGFGGLEPVVKRDYFKVYDYGDNEKKEGKVHIIFIDSESISG